MRTTLRLLVAMVGLACAEPRPARDSTSTAQPAESTGLAGSREWYRRSRAIDLTGDGVADSAVLVARGENPDSLRIAMILVASGGERFRNEWESSYELALVDTSAVRPAERPRWLKARLDSVLASVSVERFGAGAAQLMAEDSAIVAGLEARPEREISFSFGYETTVRLVWDSARSRFVPLWSCC